MNYYLDAFRKYAVFKGRATRAEYWYFFLINFIVSLAINLLTFIGLSKEGVTMLGFVYSLAVLLPSLAIFVRRMHDTNRSGWWWFLCLVPVVGAIILLVWLASKSDPQENRFGPVPPTDPKSALPNLNA